MYALYLELHLAMLVCIVLKCVADVERLLRLDVLRLTALAECNTVEYGIGLVIDKLELDVLLTAAYDLACSVITYVVCTEDRLGVIGTVRSESLHVIE